jgi:hypothetical protein
LRVRSRKNLKKKNAAITCLFLLPLIGFGSFGGFILYILDDLASFTFVMPAPNPGYFHNINDINFTHLGVMAENYEIRLEKYHIPTNITQDITFTDSNYDTVQTIHGTDNGNLHIGFSLAAQCLKYKYALDNNNVDDRLNATRMIKKFVTALSYFIAAPNGGLGLIPGTNDYYPGTLARFVAAPGQENVQGWMFDPPHNRHYNGTGDYSNWRVRLYTSRDEFGGFYLSCASVLKYVNPNVDDDSRWIVETIRTIVTQFIEGMKDTNWLLINGDGTPTGSDINPVFEGSTWQLGLLRIGATADPDKYSGLYNYVAAKTLAMGGASMGGAMAVMQDYYSNSFGLCVMLALILLEDNPLLQYHYIKNFEQTFYPTVRYHRNSFFNAAHLIFMKIIGEHLARSFINEDYSDSDIRHDVLDSLWRFKTSGWEEGVRNYNLIDRPHSTRSTSLNPDIASMERVDTKVFWRDFFENDPLGPYFSWLDFDIDFSEDSEHYLHPLSVSEYGPHHWVWEHSKLKGQGGSPTGNGLYEVAPNSFICIYWMCKVYNIF